MRAGPLTLLCWALCSAGAGTANGQSIDAIQTAWQQRQSGIKTLRVRWAEVYTAPKGLYDRVVPAKERGGQSSPPSDMRLAGEGVLTLDDNSLRVEMKRKKWSVVDSKVKDHEQSNVYTAGKNTAVTTKSTIVDYTAAEIERRKRPADIMEYTFWPISCYARGQNATFAPFDLQSFEVTGKSQIVAGRKCVELRQHSRESGTTQYLLLDPERGFHLCRYYTMTNEKMTLRLDVSYAQDSALGWVPKSWEYVATSPSGMSLGSRQVTQVAWEVNPGLEGDVFEPRLPPRTLVYDATGAEVVQYAIRDDGVPGPSVPDALVRSYDQLVDLAQAEQSRRYWWRVAITVGIGFALSVVCVLLVRGRWRVRGVSKLGAPP